MNSSAILISIHFPFITYIILLLSVVPLSNSDSDKYAACSTPYSCGQIHDVGFPFWGFNRPKFCGIPKFRLVCMNDIAYTTNIVAYMNPYQKKLFRLDVFSINTSSHTIDISLRKVLNKCHMQDTINNYIPNYNYVAYDHHPLKPILDADYRYISLFYGCTNSCDSICNPMTFSCYNYNDNTFGTAYYFGDALNINRIKNTSCSCKNNVSFPIGKGGVDEIRSRNESLLNVLMKWSKIRMEYYVNFTACVKCQESGGRCGSAEGLSSDQFICYCREGPQPIECFEPSTSKSGGRRTLVFGLAASLLGTMMLATLIIFAKTRRNTNKLSFLWSSRRTIGDQNVEAFLQSYGSLAPKRYTFADIKKVTNSFKDKLGEGGYGSVYKGKLHNGRFVAVKKLKVVKDDGKIFINEVLSISRTNHVNVVTLLGFCSEANKRALVFEFLPNGSLEKFIHGKEIRQSLQWETMYNIAIGIARGLDYLHRGCNTRILHFDIKPHNILLDDEFTPKISDFGLARLCPKKNSMISMSEARGTIGYIAPEVFCRNFGGASHKSDVYSYGMMLIDLICGRKIPTNEVQHDNSEMYFPEWIYNRLEPMEEAAVDEIEDNDKNELERKMILVSLWCIQMHPSDRPPISRVVEMLEGQFESLPMPSKPHYSSSSARFMIDASLKSTT